MIYERIPVKTTHRCMAAFKDEHGSLEATDTENDDDHSVFRVYQCIPLAILRVNHQVYGEAINIMNKKKDHIRSLPVQLLFNAGRSLSVISFTEFHQSLCLLLRYRPFLKHSGKVEVAVKLHPAFPQSEPFWAMLCDVLVLAFRKPMRICIRFREAGLSESDVEKGHKDMEQGVSFAISDFGGSLRNVSHGETITDVEFSEDWEEGERLIGVV